MTGEIFGFWLSDLFSVVAETLLHSIWQGGIIAILLTLVLLFMKKVDTRIRYAVSGLALMILVMVVVGTGWYLLASEFDLMASNSERPVMAYAQAGSKAQSSSGSASAIATSIDSGDPQTEQTGNSFISGWQFAYLSPWITFIWITGMTCIAFKHIIGWVRLKSMTITNASPISPEWATRCEDLCRRFYITRKVGLFVSENISVPCVIGFVKPVVVLPVSMLSGLTGEQIEMILVHELAHIKRYDVLVNYVQKSIETLLFFNPAVWWISRQIRAEREHCCDDFAIFHCGSKKEYARALASLEYSRRSPSLAMAADGTSLLSRVRRIAGLSARGGDVMIKGITGMIVLGMLAVFGLISVAGMSGNAVAQEKTSEPFESKRSDVEGYYELEEYEGDTLRIVYYFKNSQISQHVPKASLVGFEKFSEQFHLEQDAGTFYFVGEVVEDKDGMWSDGDCYFRANPEFFEKLEKMGVKRSLMGRMFSPRREQLQLALTDMSYDYAKEIIERSDGKVDLEDLTTLHNHGVTIPYITDMEEAGYTGLKLTDLKTLRDHGVNGEYITVLRKHGYDNLSAREVKRMRDHGVTEDFIEELADQGYTDLSAEEIVRMRDHGVDPYYIVSMNESGYEDVSPQMLVKMRDHGVDGDYVEELINIGYSDISVEGLIKMRDHGVDPYFIKSMKEAGFDKVHPDMLIKLRDHGVDGDYVEELINIGYSDISVEGLIKMRDHGVDPYFIKSMREAGFDKVHPDMLIKLRDHGVDGEYVEELINIGYSDISVEGIIKMRDHGVDPYFIKSMREVGFDKVHPDMLIKLRDHGVDGEYVKAMKEYGYAKLHPEEFIRLRDHGVDGSYIAAILKSGLIVSDPATLIRLRDHGVDGSYIGDLIEIGYDDLAADDYITLRDYGVDIDFIEDLRDGDELPSIKELKRIKSRGSSRRVVWE